MVSIVEVHQLNDVLSLRPAPRVALQLDELDARERRDWELRLNRALHACGCDEGSAGVLLALVTWVGWLATHGSGSGGWTIARNGAGALLAGGALGKGIGLHRARSSAHALARELTAVVQERQARRAVTVS